MGIHGRMEGYMEYLDKYFYLTFFFPFYFTLHLKFTHAKAKTPQRAFLTLQTEMHLLQYLPPDEKPTRKLSTQSIQPAAFLSVTILEEPSSSLKIPYFPRNFVVGIYIYIYVNNNNNTA